jgi:hypothetical protein
LGQIAPNIRHLTESVDHASVVIVREIDEPANPREQQASETHGAGLKGYQHGKLAAITVKRELFFKEVQHHHFGMTIRVKAVLENFISALGQYLAPVINQHGSDPVTFVFKRCPSKFAATIPQLIILVILVQQVVGKRSL